MKLFGRVLLFLFLLSDPFNPPANQNSGEHPPLRCKVLGRTSSVTDQNRWAEVTTTLLAASAEVNSGNASACAIDRPELEVFARELQCRRRPRSADNRPSQGPTPPDLRAERWASVWETLAVQTSVKAGR